MLNVITVDDELLNLTLLKKFLEEEGQVQVVAQFSDPLHLLDQAATINPDVAFVDIEMPVMNGLELAEKLLDLCPDTQVIFVTAYSQYAIEAFHVNALDYLLKPIEAQEIKRVIQKIANTRSRQMTIDASQEPVCDQGCRIHTLGCFDVFSAHSKKPIRWLTSKVEELFAYLILHVGKDVSKEELCNVLWPESDYENGMMNLYSTVYRLRKTFANESIPLVISSGKYGYQVAMDACFLDYKVIDELAEGLKKQRLDTESESDIAGMMEAVNIYNGELFGVRSYLWSAAYGESLNRSYKVLSYRLIDAFLNLKRADAAENCLNKLLSHFPEEEKACMQLMTLYYECGDMKSVDRCRETYTKYLDETLNVEPSEAFQIYCESLSHTQVQA